MGKTSEDTANEHSLRTISAEQKRNPAIVILASELNLHSIVETLVRTSRRDYFVFVTISDSSNPLVATVAEKFDAAPIESNRSDSSPPRGRIEQLVRALGFPGILYVSSPDGRIDFSRAEQVLEETDEFGTDAPLVGDSEPTRTGTVVAIPAYNEGDTIEEVVTDVQRWAEEVIVVSDGSTDDTAVKAEQAGATVVEHETNSGYGAALKTAISEAHRHGAEELVVLDGDGQHDPEDIPKLLDKRRETDANVVVASRFLGDGKGFVPWYRRFGLWVINLLTNLSLGGLHSSSWVSDTQSGFRVYDREMIRSLARDETISDGMAASTDILYHAKRQGYDVEEIGTTIEYDGDGTSTQNPVVHGLSVVNNILQTAEQERPLTFFGLPGLAIALVGFGAGYWSVLNYLQSNTFPAGLALLCMFFTFVGCLLTLTGIILHSLNLQLERFANGTVPRGE